MKRLALALGVVAAAAFAAPLSAQTRNGPWWDPSNTGNRGTVDNRTGTVNNDGRIYDSRNADGQWRRQGRDRNGNYIYVRTVRDSRGNIIRESARRDTRGRYQVIDRRVIQSANNRNNRNDRIRDHSDHNNDGYEDDDHGDRNDRWDQNNGHDNGKHNGWYKDKNKNKNKAKKGKGRD